MRNFEGARHLNDEEGKEFSCPPSDFSKRVPSFKMSDSKRFAAENETWLHTIVLFKRTTGNRVTDRILRLREE